MQILKELKKTNFIIILLTLFCFANCKNNIQEDKLTDKEFIEFINAKTYTKSIKRIDSLIEIIDYSDHKLGILYFEKGRNLANLEKDVEAFGSLKKAIVLFEKEGNKKFIAKSNMILGDLETLLSNNKKASNHIFKAISIFKEIKDKKGEAKALNSLAHNEFVNGDIVKPIAYLKQAILIQEEIKDTLNLSAT